MTPTAWRLCGVGDRMSNECRAVGRMKADREYSRGPAPLAEFYRTDSCAVLLSINSLLSELHTIKVDPFHSILHDHNSSGLTHDKWSPYLLIH
jgi:hypothetical protein